MDDSPKLWRRRQWTPARVATGSSAGNAAVVAPTRAARRRCGCRGPATPPHSLPHLLIFLPDCSLQCRATPSLLPLTLLPSSTHSAEFGLAAWGLGLPLFLLYFSSASVSICRNFGKLPIGVVCVADVQFKWRGRSKNVWESPPGCLMFSFTSQMQDARKLPLMQYVVCLSMTEAIKELCRAKDKVA